MATNNQNQPQNQRQQRQQQSRRSRRAAGTAMASQSQQVAVDTGRRTVLTTKLIKVPDEKSSFYETFRRNNKASIVVCATCSNLLEAFVGYANYCSVCKTYIDVPLDAKVISWAAVEHEERKTNKVVEGRWHLTTTYLGYRNPHGETTDLPKLYTELDILLGNLGNISKIKTFLDYDYEDIDEDNGDPVVIFGCEEDADDGDILVLFKSAHNTPIYSGPDPNSRVSTFMEEGELKTIYWFSSAFFEAEYAFVNGKYFSTNNRWFTVDKVASTQNLLAIKIHDEIDIPKRFSIYRTVQTNYRSANAEYYQFLDQPSSFLLKKNALGYTPFNQITINKVMAASSTRKLDANSITLLCKRLSSSDPTIPWQDCIAITHILLKDQIVEVKKWHNFLRVNWFTSWWQRPDVEFNEHLEDPFKPKIPYWTMALAGVMAVIFLIYADRRRRMTIVGPKPAMLGAWSVFASFGAIMTRQTNAWFSCFDFDRMHPTTFKRKIINVLSWCSFGMQLPSIHRTASMKVTDYRCKPTVGSKLFGIAFKYCIPVVPRNCTCNALLGIAGRAIKDRSDPLPNIYTELYEFACTTLHFDNIIKQFGMIERTPRLEWYKHISSSSKNAIKNVTTNKLEQLCDWEDYTNIKAFTKMENISKFDGDGNYEDFCPRIISSCTPQYLVATGDWGYSLSKRLQTLWNGDDTMITYALRIF